MWTPPKVAGDIPPEASPQTQSESSPEQSLAELAMGEDEQRDAILQHIRSFQQNEKSQTTHGNKGRAGQSPGRPPKQNSELPPGITEDDPKYLQQFALKNLQPVHLALARYAAAGARRKDIAKLFNLTPERVGTLLKSPVVREAIMHYQNEMFGEHHKEFFASRMQKVYNEIDDALDNGSEIQRRWAATQVMDRTMGKAEQHIKTTDNTIRELLLVVQQKYKVLPNETKAEPETEIEDAQVVKETTTDVQTANAEHIDPSEIDQAIEAL